MRRPEGKLRRYFHFPIAIGHLSATEPIARQAVSAGITVSNAKWKMLLTYCLVVD
jgi:hypothetical protein